jgi:hypothetical protein
MVGADDLFCVDENDEIQDFNPKEGDYKSDDYEKYL